MMPTYELKHDLAGNLVTCRIKAQLSHAEAVTLANELLALTTATRRRTSTLRLLFDNREGMSFASRDFEAVVAVLRSIRKAGDRVAVLVSSSLMKVRTKKNMNQANQVFISEPAAMMWLNAWENEAAAPARVRAVAGY